MWITWIKQRLAFQLCVIGNGLVSQIGSDSWLDVSLHYSDVIMSRIAFQITSPVIVYSKRKPPCIGGKELVSLSCNRVFISAESVGRGWCKTRIATKWYQFCTTDKCGFLFMPWITDQYTFVRYTKLVNKIGTTVEKITTFSIMTT